MTNSRPSLDTLKVPDTSNQRSNSSHSARSSEFSMIVDVETLAAPDGGVSQNTAELLSHAFRPTADEPRESETEPLLSPDIGRRPTSGSRPWYKKASPWW
ncbi:hypothetical protein FRC02_012202 [Tulasnella sp. 418]|nr:hypothetical protein FRC02_012202 [Tulasnella sp. 418]